MEATSSLVIRQYFLSKGENAKLLPSLLSERLPEYVFQIEQGTFGPSFVTTLPRARHAELLAIKSKVRTFKLEHISFKIRVSDGPAEPPALTEANRAALDTPLGKLGLSNTRGVSAIDWARRSGEFTVPPDVRVLCAGHVAQKTWTQLLGIHDLGVANLAEIEAALLIRGLGLGMDVGNWVPPTRIISAPPLDVQRQRVDTLTLSKRSRDALRNDNIIYMGDLIQKTEAEMLRIPNFGRISLNEMVLELAQIECKFGTELSDWSPNDLKT